jgi:hypothetical protein
MKKIFTPYVPYKLLKKIVSSKGNPMKIILLTLLTLAPLTTVIAEEVTVHIKPPLSNIVFYKAKLTSKPLDWGERKQIYFTAKIRLDKAANHAHVTILSYDDVGYYFSDFETDIKTQIKRNLARWFAENTNIVSFSCMIHDENDKQITFESRTILGRPDTDYIWKAIYTVTPDTLIG